MKEAAWQAIIAKELRLLKAVVLNKLGTSFEGRGWPDLYVAHSLWTGWLELKITARETDSQIQRIKMMRRNGVDARFCRLVNNREFHYDHEFVTLGHFDCQGPLTKPDSVRALARLRFLRQTNQLVIADGN